MPKPTTKNRQDLRSRFVRNAIPSEADFADLIAASLNQADDGVLKLPDQPLGLVRQKPDQPVLRFYADPAAEGSAWQLQLGSGDKPGFGLAAADGRLALFVDGASGNVGIGTAAAGARLTIQGDFNATKDPQSRLRYGGVLGIKSYAPTIDFIDTDIGNQWAIHVNESRMYFVREPWENEDLVLDGRGSIGMGCVDPQGKLNIRERTGTPASALQGTLLLDHEDAGGASSIVFRSKVNRGSDYAFIEFRDKNPAMPAEYIEAALLTIGVQNDGRDHIALMPSGNVGVGTTVPAARLNILEIAGTPASALQGTLLLDHEDAGGASSIVFRSKVNRGSDHGFIEYRDKNPAINDIEAALLTIGNQNDINDHIALMPSGNVGIGTTTPGFKLEINGSAMLSGSLFVKGTFVRLISATSGNGPTEGLDMGRLNSRTIRINKLFPETALRIVYCDNFRVNGDNVACRWEIRVDGNSVNPPIIADRYELTGNRHLHGTIMGYARGVSSGTHEIQVWIVSHPHNQGRGTDADTGWNNSTWTLEVEEVWLA